MTNDKKERDLKAWLQDLLKLTTTDVSESRNHFLLLSAWMYASEQLEGLSPEESAQIMQDGFKVEDIMKKWNVDSLAEFLDAVSLLSSMRIIEYIRHIIGTSDLFDTDKQKLLKPILEMNINDTWDVKSYGKTK